MDASEVRGLNLDDFPDFRRYKSSRDRKEVWVRAQAFVEGYDAAVGDLERGATLEEMQQHLVSSLRPWAEEVEAKLRLRIAQAPALETGAGGEEDGMGPTETDSRGEEAVQNAEN